jgi:lysozyme family protein
MTPIELLIGKLLDREGGIADVGDGKGVTRFGQTPAWLAQFNLQPPNTREEAAVNYLAWLNLVGLTSIIAVGDGLADILLDVAVMSGHRQAIMALQSALSVTADGVLGPKTLAALAGLDRRALTKAIIAWDMEFEGRIIVNNPARAKDAAGWASRLAGHVRRL